MRPLFLLLVCLTGWAIIAPAQTLGVIGSSTAYGYNASTPDSTWVNRTAAYYRSLGALNHLYNLALPGATSFAGMPSSYIPPNSSFPRPATDNNVTKLISLGSDVILVNYPTNDFILGYSLTQYLSNLRTIYDTAVAAGKRCFVTTTQPRNDASTGTRQLLREGRDSVLAEFGTHALNFWDPVTDPTTLGILPQYNSGDGIHVNDAGHALFFQAAKAANIMGSAPLPLVLTDLRADWLQQAVLLVWSATNKDLAGAPFWFEIQRSPDGKSFQSLQHIDGTSPAANTANNYSYTDNTPLPGKSYYRLRWMEGQQESFSRILSVMNPLTKFSISKIYRSAGGEGYLAEISLPQEKAVEVIIVNSSGLPVDRQSYSPRAATTLIPVTAGRLPAGVYFVRITLSDGTSATKPLTKF